MAEGYEPIPNSGIDIVECGVFAPTQIGPVNYHAAEIQLTKSYDRTKHTIIATPLSDVDIAWVYITARWVNDSKIKVYITNTYQQSSQYCGFSWCIVRYA